MLCNDNNIVCYISDIFVLYLVHLWLNHLYSPLDQHHNHDDNDGDNEQCSHDCHGDHPGLRPASLCRCYSRSLGGCGSRSRGRCCCYFILKQGSICASVTLFGGYYRMDWDPKLTVGTLGADTVTSMTWDVALYTATFTASAIASCLKL